MRVAVLVGAFPKLSETFVLNQVTGLIDRGHDVHIFANEVGDAGAAHDEVASYRLFERAHYSPALPRSTVARVAGALPLFGSTLRRSPGSAAALLNVVKFGRSAASLRLLYYAAPFRNLNDFDILLCHFGPVGIRTAWLRDAGVVRGRLVTVFHGFDMSVFLRNAKPGVYNHLFRTGDLFLPISEAWRRRLIALGCPASKTHVHRMGIDCARFKFTPREPPNRGPLRVVTVARLVEKKGVEYAIRAVARLVAAGVDIEYTVVGDGPLREMLSQLTEGLGVSGCVKLIGYMAHSDIAALLQRSHVMLAPSVTASDGDMEGLPVAIMEAMASGLPVVSTIHSGIPELIDDDVNGYLVPEKDVSALAAKLEHVAFNTADWRRVADAARRAVVERHDIRTLNDKLAALLGGLA